MADDNMESPNRTSYPTSNLISRLRFISTFWLVAIGAGNSASALAEEHPLAIEANSKSPLLSASRPGLIVTHPRDHTILPPEMPPVTFRWQDSDSKSDRWVIDIQVPGSANALHFETRQSEWTPSPTDWDFIKKKTMDLPAIVTISGGNREQPDRFFSSASVALKTSKIPVGAPIFFREVSLPFQEAARNPTALRWRLGDVANPERAPIVLENMPVCGNCHSFSKKAMVMDVDYPNKGAFVHSRIVPEMTVSDTNIHSWEESKASKPTLGLLAQISPDGKWLVGTINDKSIVAAKGELAYSQVFLPVRGILAVYNLETGAMTPLPGANDPQYVQTNPSWSPDGQYLVFARAKALDMEDDGKPLASRREAYEFLQSQKTASPFRFDLYRIPFNGGRGGEAEVLPGAANNGFSNFYPKYSPDGRWIVFCRADRHMMIQPDSQLWIMNSEGGQERRMEANTPGMNSWHSWSPNGRWLVFSSKAFSPYTQLWLTHIDANGASSPAVCLDYMSDPEYAANLPEFAPLAFDGISRIKVEYALELTWLKTGDRLLKEGKLEEAMAALRKSVDARPNNPEALQKLGLLLYYRMNQADAGMASLEKAAGLVPGNAYIQYDLGTMLLDQGRFEQAVVRLEQSLKAMTENFESEYNPFDSRYKLGLWLSPRHVKGRLVNPIVDIQLALGRALYEKGDYAKSVQQLQALAAGDGIRQADVHAQLALSLLAVGDKEAAAAARAKAERLNPLYLQSAAR